MFLYPVYKSPNLSPRLKLIAKRTLIAAFIALLTSVVNICVLTVLHGKELGAICLGSCGLDTTVNALAVFAVTSPIEDNNSREPSPKQTDVADVIRPKPILHSSIIGASVGTGNGIGIGRGGGSGGGILETAPPEYRSANSNSNGNGNGNGTRSVHFPPEVTSRVQSSGMGGGNGNGSGNGIGTVTIIDMDADADADADGKAIVERRRRDEADRLERGLVGIRVGVGIGEDVIQPGIMDDFGPAAMGYIPTAVPAAVPAPAVGGSRNGTTRTTNEVHPVIRPSNSSNRRTTTANTTTNPTPAPASASPPIRQYRPRNGRGSGEIEMRTAAASATSATTTMTSIISSDYPRPGTPEETSVEIKHEPPSSLMAVTATKFRALSASASTRIKAKPKRLPWSMATTNVDGPPSGPGDLINVNENALGNVAAIEMRESNMAGGSGSGSGSLSSSLSGVLRQSPVPPSPSIILTKSTTTTTGATTTTGTGTIDTEDGQLQERLPNAMTPLALTETPSGSGGGSIGEGSSRNGSLRLAPDAATASTATATSNTPTTTTAASTAAVAGRTNGRPSSMSLEVSVTTRTDQIVEQVRRKKPRGLIEDYDGSQSSTRTRRSRSSTGGL
ncbi:hypothetical protein FRC14_000872 [Serendipita sp. 396]|nr:hypothetical protein FRC14_000872 [Serendipita sp. 396]KAG8859219.1 hypothetical protein FRC20_011864 [Serendipita sp. 405]